MNRNIEARRNYANACRALRAAAKFSDDRAYATGTILREQIIRDDVGAAIYTAAHRSVFLPRQQPTRLVHLMYLLAHARRNHIPADALRADVRTDALIHYFIPLP